MKSNRESTATVHLVERQSIAEELGILPGYRLLEINGAAPEDVIDYLLAESEESLTLHMLSPEGEEFLFDVDKDPHEKLGLGFESAVFDGVRRCNNDCPFCFVDQMPQGYRETLYIRDDDYRLSFLSGHFVTMTNVSDAEIERIIRRGLSPLNISVHATAEEVRRRVLGVKKSREILPLIRHLTSHGIEVNTQVVVSPGLNDGVHLDRTVSDLASFFPNVATVAVVPVGLTRHREGLPNIRSFTREMAREHLRQVNGYRDTYQPRFGVGFVYAADEMYVIAQEPVPTSEYYDEFPQMENGVGMLRLFEDEMAQLRNFGKSPYPIRLQVSDLKGIRKITLVTGVAATPWLQTQADWIADFFRVECEVITVANRLLGDSVTVAGLLCGEDIHETLCKRDLGDVVFLPSVCVGPEQKFLDDTTVQQLASRLNVHVCASSRWPMDVYHELTQSKS